MNKKNIIIAVLAIVVLAAIIWKTPGSKTSETQETIKIGYFGPFTGPVAGSSGEDVAQGFKLAAKEYNRVNSKKIEVIYEDDACDPKKAVSAAQKLIAIDKVNILVSGVCSGSTLAVVPIAESNKVILFTPVSTSPKITTAGDYVFRTSASGEVTGQTMATLIRELGFSKAAVLFEAADYTVGLKDAFLESWNSISGNTVAGIESVVGTDTDMKTQITKLSASKPDVLVYILNSTVTGTIAFKQTKDLGIEFPIVGNEYFGFKEIVSNPLAEGIYAAVYEYDEQAPAFLGFLKKYQGEFKKGPSQAIYSGLAYDGYNVLFKALETCDGDDSECVKEALYNTKNYQGITGAITIDENGDTERKFTLKQIKGGALVSID